MKTVLPHKIEPFLVPSSMRELMRVHRIFLIKYIYEDTLLWTGRVQANPIKQPESIIIACYENYRLLQYHHNNWYVKYL